MILRKLFVVFLLPSLLFAYGEEAWWAGPIITRGSIPIKVGTTQWETLLFSVDRYGTYNKNWSLKQQQPLYSLNGTTELLTGLIHRVDIKFGAQIIHNMTKDKHYTGVGDTDIQLRYQVVEETKYRPAVAIILQEVFPTGNYTHSNPAFVLTAGTGGGAWLSNIGLRFQKSVLFAHHKWLRWRFTSGYTIPSSVNITKPTIYGGGFGAHGVVLPGKILTVANSIEYQLTQNWVLVCDFLYVHTNRTTFTGYPGVTATGNLATVGKPSSEQFSIAPAFEYNFNADVGITAGIWATCRGRNSAVFFTPTILSNIYF